MKHKRGQDLILTGYGQALLFSDVSENTEKSYFRVHLEGPDRKLREMHYSSFFWDRLHMNSRGTGETMLIKLQASKSIKLSCVQQAF
jgi:hypothetical protein